MPALASRMWHFPAPALARLKADASAAPGDSSSWISTYDAVIALVWRGVTRAKQALLRPDPDRATSTLGHAVDVRRRAGPPPLPAGFLGNAIVVARAATEAVTPAYVGELAEWVAGLGDRRWIHFDVECFLGLDFCATSWQLMSAYTKHDFGFGLPRALRWPNPATDGYLYVFPSRAHLVGGDEGLEVCICLEEKAADRLMEDETMLEYAHPRL